MNPGLTSTRNMKAICSIDKAQQQRGRSLHLALGLLMPARTCSVASCGCN